MNLSTKYRPARPSRPRFAKAKPGSNPGNLIERTRPGHTPTLSAGAGNGSRRASRPRPVSKHWKDKPAVIKRGDREICNPATVEGCAEYKYRVLLMWLRQEGWCCFHKYDFCPGRLHLAEATFEHHNKRGKDRDDRIWDEQRMMPLNGAAHAKCNSIVGSRRLAIEHGSNYWFELEVVNV